MERVHRALRREEWIFHPDLRVHFMTLLGMVFAVMLVTARSGAIGRWEHCCFGWPKQYVRADSCFWQEDELAGVWDEFHLATKQRFAREDCAGPVEKEPCAWSDLHGGGPYCLLAHTMGRGWRDLTSSEDWIWVRAHQRSSEEDLRSIYWEALRAETYLGVRLPGARSGPAYCRRERWIGSVV